MLSDGSDINSGMVNGKDRPKYTFRDRDRLKREEDFAVVRKRGRKFAGEFMVIWVYKKPATGTSAPRLGLSVRRTYGTAVKRNKFKRQVREIFRINKHMLMRDIDIIVAPDLNRKTDDFWELRKDMLNILGNAGAVRTEGC